MHTQRSAGAYWTGVLISMLETKMAGMFLVISLNIERLLKEKFSICGCELKSEPSKLNWNANSATKLCIP